MEQNRIDSGGKVPKNVTACFPKLHLSLPCKQVLFQQILPLLGQYNTANG